MNTLLILLATVLPTEKPTEPTYVSWRDINPSVDVFDFSLIRGNEVYILAGSLSPLSWLTECGVTTVHTVEGQSPYPRSEPLGIFYRRLACELNEEFPNVKFHFGGFPTRHNPFN